MNEWVFKHFIDVDCLIWLNNLIQSVLSLRFQFIEANRLNLFEWLAWINDRNITTFQAINWSGQFALIWIIKLDQCGKIIIDCCIDLQTWIDLTCLNWIIDVTKSEFYVSSLKQMNSFESNSLKLTVCNLFIKQNSFN